MRNLFTKITLLLCALLLSVNMLGNTVSSANSSSDVKNGRIEMKGNHATFYLSDISTYEYNGRSSWAYVIGTVKKSSSKTLTLSWITDGDYDIKVTNIRFHAKAYTSGEWAVKNGKIIVAGSEYTIGTIHTDARGFDVINESGNFTGDISIVCKNNESGALGYSFDYFIKDITITYTATPKIKTKEGNVEVTICPEAPKTIDLNTCLTNKDNHLSYTFSCTAEGANIEETTFSASQTGNYTINVAVGTKDNCHEAALTTFMVTATPAALTLTAPTASEITYHNTLIASKLTGGSARVGSCDVAGTWTWKDPETTPSIGENQSFPVVFTPSENAGNYTNFETTATINVKRAQFVFIGNGTAEDDPKHVNWCYDENWEDNQKPGSEDEVLIDHNVVIRQEVSVYSVTITEGDTLTIMPTGGLTVGAGGIIGATTGNLILKAGTEGATKGQTGYLRISPESAEPMPEATVELFSTTWYNKSNEAGNTTRFQCVGTPIAENGIVASTVFPTGTLLYAWNESSERWTNTRTKALEPFKGYDLSQKINNDGISVAYSGLLTSDNKAIDLAYSSSEKGFNLLANSYTAPMSIEMFDDADFINASQTIYILNAGTKAESAKQLGGLDAPGKWVGIPIKTAAELVAEGYPCVIPSMQGFWIKAEGENAKLNLNYDRLVYGVDYTGATANKPLRVAKSRDTEETSVGKLKIDIYTEGDADCLIILESDSYDSAYEDGYDARKIASETMDLFTIRDNEQLGVDATNSIAGTRIGVRTGEEMTYTMTFSHHDSEANLMLWDKEASFKMLLSEGVEYTFNAAPNSEITERFQIIAADIPAIATGVDEVESEVHVQKFIKDNQLYILKDGVLYNASGAVVRK